MEGQEMSAIAEAARRDLGSPSRYGTRGRAGTAIVEGERIKFYWRSPIAKLFPSFQHFAFSGDLWRRRDLPRHIGRQGAPL